MSISGIKGQESMSGQMNINSMNTNDAESVGIQNKITTEQQKLQKLSNNQELTAEEKKQQKQESQRQIAELNRKLRERQIELRRKQLEKQEAEKQANENNQVNQNSQSEQKEDKIRTDDKTIDTTKNGKALVSAFSKEKQADDQKKVVVALEGKARILKSEIRQDSLRGQNTKDKEKNLKDIEKKINNTSRVEVSLRSGAGKNASQINSLDDKSKKQQTSRTDNKLAAEFSNSANKTSQNVLQNYNNAGKMFSSVNFHV